MSLCGRYICPRCGRETDKLVEGLCPKCYAEIKGPETIPKVLEAEVCRYCGSVRLGYRWSENNNSFELAIIKVVEHNLREVGKKSTISDITIKEVVFLTKPNWTTRLLVEFQGKVEGVEVFWRVPITVRLIPSICPKCKTKISGEYDTVVQVRGHDPKEVENVVPEVAKEAGVINDIIDIIRHKDGIDIFFSHLGAARKFIKSLSRRFALSWKGPFREVIGLTSSGRNRTRNTLVVRIEKRL